MRTLAYKAIQHNIQTNFVEAMAGTNYRSFFLLTLEDRPRRNLWKASKGKPLGLEVMHAFHVATALYYHGNGTLHSVWGQHWSGLDQRDLLFRRNPACKLARNVDAGFHLMFIKVRRCYQMLRGFEHVERRKFDFVIRLRPDVLVMRPVLHVSKMNILPEEVGIPDGVTGYYVNDHLAVCAHPKSCDAYFLLHNTYEECHGELPWTHNPSVNVLYELQSHNVSVHLLDLPYTLFRPCPLGASQECNRLDYRVCRRRMDGKLQCNDNVNRRYIPECKEVSRNICSSRKTP